MVGYFMVTYTGYLFFFYSTPVATARPVINNSATIPITITILV
jgi:hypothetical protein